jgi:hypothetical protein
MKLNLLTQKLYSYFFECYLGIRTTGFVAPTVQWGVHYTPLPYQAIRRILDRLSLEENDVFVDIGCGKGRVICCACRRPLRRTVGIEVNEELLRLAVANAGKVRHRKAPFEGLAMPAEEYDYPDATVIYLYNPFDRPIMDKVMGRITESYRRSPRDVRVAYANCLHEDSLRQTGWLVKREEWPASLFPGFGCPISFWSSMSNGDLHGS